MSESVLVIPSPLGCFDCPLFREGIVDTCFPLDRDIHDEEGGFDKYGGRPSWCPLRPLPQEWTMDEVKPCAYNEGFVDGLNHCIYLITGEIK